MGLESSVLRFLIGSTVKINVVYAADKEWVPHLAASLTSLLQTNRDAIGRLFVIGALSGHRPWARLQKFAMSNFGIVLELIEPPLAEIEGLFTSRGISHASWYRLFLGELLPTEVKHVLYMDADTVVVGSLEGLRDMLTDFSANQGSAIRAVESSQRMDHFSQFSHPGNRYFNAGVLLVDLIKFRQGTSAQQLTDTAKRYGSKLRFHDQDVLNLHFGKDFVPLDPMYNTMRSTRISDSVSIVHFVGPRKPWLGSGRHHPYSRSYRQARRLTPFYPYLWADLIEVFAPRFYASLKSMIDTTYRWMFRLRARIPKGQSNPGRSRETTKV